MVSLCHHPVPISQPAGSTLHSLLLVKIYGTTALISMTSGVVFILFRLSVFLVTWSSHAARGSHDTSRFDLNHAMMGSAVSGMNKTPTGKYDENDPLSFYATTLLSTGTTICGLQCVDGVVLGADSRSTSGQLIADPNKKKIRQLAPSIVVAGK